MKTRVANERARAIMRMMGLPLLILLGLSRVSVLIAANGLASNPQQNCLLEPTEGSKQTDLSKGITGQTTWSACNSIIQDFVFSWPRKQGFPATSKEALQRASTLLTEWRQVMKMDAVADGKFNYASGMSPFGDLSTALIKRAAESDSYIFGEGFPVTPENPGWDGAWVSLSSTTQTTQLTIHYWANP